MIGLIYKNPNNPAEHNVVVSEPYPDHEGHYWVTCVVRKEGKDILDEIPYSELMGCEVTKIIKPR